MSSLTARRTETARQFDLVSTSITAPKEPLRMRQQQQQICPDQHIKDKQAQEQSPQM